MLPVLCFSKFGSSFLVDYFFLFKALCLCIFQVDTSILPAFSAMHEFFFELPLLFFFVHVFVFWHSSLRISFSY